MDSGECAVGHPGTEPDGPVPVPASEPTTSGDAFHEFYARHRHHCYAFAFRLLGDSSLAEDVVQEGFLALWSAGPRVDAARGSALSLLLNITHHRAVDVIRVEERQRAVSRRLDTPLHPDLALWNGVTATDLHAALTQLTPTHRQVVVLHYFADMSLAEIAMLTGVPPGTVKSRLYAGRTRLRSLLSDE